MVAQQGVGQDQQLSHDGGEGDLGRLTGGSERVVLGLQVGVEADGDQGRHVDGLAQAGASAADEALAAVLAGVTGDGRETGEAGGAAVLQGAKFRHLDQQGQRGGL